MDSRFQDFLKVCEINEDPGEYIKEKLNFIDKKLKSESFQNELKHHSALANKNRLLIYQLIQDSELSNGALAKILGLSEGSITHHIKKLDEARLIIGRNKGHFIIYYTTEDFKKQL
jgi:DNA-binding transcriptional ArsR family regulator